MLAHMKVRTISWSIGADLSGISTRGKGDSPLLYDNEKYNLIYIYFIKNLSNNVLFFAFQYIIFLLID